MSNSICKEHQEATKKFLEKLRGTSETKDKKKEEKK